MGLFDDVRCDYPLPEGAPTDGYQTKDTAAQSLETYLIAEDGRLLDENGAVVPFHGSLNFSASNVSGSGPNGYLTNDDKRAEFWDFTARYDHGTLLDLTGGRQPVPVFYDREPCPRKKFWRDEHDPAPAATPDPTAPWSAGDRKT